MKALVISGGGSKGAFAGGIVEYLYKECENDYQIFVGTSTGSLLIPHIAQGKIDEIKELYTSTTANDIFDINPFQLKKGLIQINHLNVIRMFAKGEKTFGSSKNLLNTIRRNLSREDYENIKKSGKQLHVSVANLTSLQMEYKSSLKEDYDNFTEWMWASANEVPFMSLLVKNGYEYADGGFGSQIPINEALRLGATEVDVIILRPEGAPEHKKPLKNPFQTFFRIMDFMHNQIVYDDLRVGIMEAVRKQVQINYYYLPDKLTENSLIFDATQMKKWWQEGYEFAQKHKPECRLT